MNTTKNIYDIARPNTVTSLEADLRRLGVREGMTLIVHSSLSSLGWVCGGAASVILALEHVLSDAGTLVMPTHSGELSDPAGWVNPPVPESWWETIRNETPAFDRDLTPTSWMGAIPETFRKQREVARSGHPHYSFAAWGKHRDDVLRDDHLDFGLDDESPLGRVYGLGGFILLLGVGYENNTSLHLAEYRARYSGKREIEEFAPVTENGTRVWKGCRELDFDTGDFGEIGQAYEAAGNGTRGRVGRAESRLLDQRDLVDFATAWMEANRGTRGPS